MNYYESLRQYYQNGCVLHPGTPPKWGEVGYKEFMAQKISDMNIKPGDTIKAEQKWSSGKTEKYEGIVLHIYDDRMFMLSEGKSVWKNKSNRKDIIIEYITNIEKTKDAKPDFDIFRADPDYKSIKNSGNDEFWQTIEQRRSKRFLERTSDNFPDVDTQNSMILWLLCEFYWGYQNGSVQEAEISIINKDGSSISLPKYKNKHIYPNRTYYSACGTKFTDKENDGILLFFNSFEELNEIRLISCAWTVDMEEKELHFVQLVYPKFIKSDGNVFNISFRCTDMQFYEYSLNHPTTFSGRMEREWDVAFVYHFDKMVESILEIMNNKDINYDFLLPLLLNDMHSAIQQTYSDRNIHTEVFEKSTQIKSRPYVWQY